MSCTMRKLSTGQDSTLENWIALSATVFGDDSAQVAFLEEKAKNSPKGLQEEVWADEGQLLGALLTMNQNAERELLMNIKGYGDWLTNQPRTNETHTKKGSDSE